MPQVDPSTPTIEREFYGNTFAVPAPYVKGYKLSEAEAVFMNSQLATVVGNRYGARFRAAEKKGEALADPAATFAELFAAYKVGESNRATGTGTVKSADPLARTIRFLAEEDLKARIISAGHKVKDFMAAPSTTEGHKSRYAELLSASIALGTNKDGTRNWKEEAEGIIARRAEATSADPDLILAPSAPVADAA